MQQLIAGDEEGAERWLRDPEQRAGPGGWARDRPGRGAGYLANTGETRTLAAAGPCYYVTAAVSEQ